GPGGDGGTRSGPAERLRPGLGPGGPGGTGDRDRPGGLGRLPLRGADGDVDGGRGQLGGRCDGPRADRTGAGLRTVCDLGAVGGILPCDVRGLVRRHVPAGDGIGDLRRRRGSGTGDAVRVHRCRRRRDLHRPLLGDGGPVEREDGGRRAHDEHGQRPERGPDRADPRLVGVRPHGGELTGMRQFIRPWLWAVGVYFALDLLISLLVGTANPLWFLLCPFLAAVAADWVHALH